MSQTTFYDLIVTYDVSPADDIDIIAEGIYARERYHSPTEALSGLGSFIEQHGGPAAWNELDQHEIASCWLPHGEGTEIAYQARLERVRLTQNQPWARPVTSPHSAVVTWRRLNAANFGSLGEPASQLLGPQDEM